MHRFCFIGLKQVFPLGRHKKETALPWHNRTQTQGGDDVPITREKPVRGRAGCHLCRFHGWLRRGAVRGQLLPRRTSCRAAETEQTGQSGQRKGATVIAAFRSLGRFFPLRRRRPRGKRDLVGTVSDGESAQECLFESIFVPAAQSAGASEKQHTARTSGKRFTGPAKRVRRMR